MQIVNGTKWLECGMAKNNAMQNIMLAYYRPIVQKEVRLSGAKPSHIVLCVGGGHFPATAILFHQLSGAKVVVVDNDKKAIVSARQVVKSLGLEGKVIVKYVDGGDVSGEKFNIVHIAMQISPKEQVFNHMYSTIKAKSRVVVRVPKACLEKGYQPFENVDVCDGFVIQPSYSNIERTLLYVK
ncbi:MAG: hypothetical protein ATN35_12060 [Epulopiscium sp. Nele67-Bin004]|nr:MAG: hypothetical protein ATN35_12060 [Epulopiscium sp. Nele67-Bin004]